MSDATSVEDVEADVGQETGEEGGSEKLVRLLLGGRLRRNRRLRRLLFARLLKERMEGGEEEDEDDEGDVDGGEGNERARKLVGLLVVGRTRRHRQLRRLLAAHLAREKA